MENNQDAYKSMYLSTLPNKKQKFANKKSALDVSDIQGARSRYIEHPMPIRQTPIVAYDIDKSRPKQLIPEYVNKPSYILSVDDIQGTRTKINKFTTTRNTNPLQPRYQQPQVQFVQAEQPKFIRDTLQIDDIEGVRTRQTFANRVQKSGKVINIKQEIVENIKPTPKGFVRSNTEANSSLNVKDINKGEPWPTSKRITNPLTPVYDAPGQQAYGIIEKSQSVNKIAKIYNKPDFTLKTEDIDGAKTKYNNFIIEKKEDIAGTKPESLKRGISSNRRTNPLAPSYNYPGWSQMGQRVTFTRPKTAHQRFDQFIK